MLSLKVLRCGLPYAKCDSYCLWTTAIVGMRALVEILSWSLITRGDSTTLYESSCCSRRLKSMEPRCLESDFEALALKFTALCRDAWPPAPWAAPARCWPFRLCCCEKPVI